MFWARIVNPQSVLIVEDLPETLNWLKSLVSEVFPNAQLVTAETLKAARQEIQRHEYELILLDLGMPDGTGLDLIREIRNDPKSGTYIVVTTIFDDDENLRSALRLGANGYLLKDDDQAEMIANLRNLISDRPPFSTRALNKMVQDFHVNSEDDVKLTIREEEVLRLIAKGYNVSQAAEMLQLTSNTVKGYLKTIYSKLGISSRAEATSEAIRRKLVAP